MRRDRDWAGIAVVVLAVGVVAAILVGEVAAFRNPARIVSAEEVATISTVLGAAVGAIATYLGTRPRKRPPEAPGQARAGDGEQPGITRPPDDPAPQNRSKSPDSPEHM